MALPTSGSIASLSSRLTANLSTPPTLVIHYYRQFGFGIWGEENVQKDFIQLFYGGRYVEGSISSLCSLLADPCQHLLLLWSSVQRSRREEESVTNNLKCKCSAFVSMFVQVQVKLWSFLLHSLRLKHEIVNNTTGAANLNLVFPPVARREYQLDKIFTCSWAFVPGIPVS